MELKLTLVQVRKLVAAYDEAKKRDAFEDADAYEDALDIYIAKCDELTNDATDAVMLDRLIMGTRHFNPESSDWEIADMVLGVLNHVPEV